TKWAETSSSFIFSLNRANVGQSIVSRVINYSKAIRNSHGPSFGDGDLWVKVTCVRNLALPSFCRPRSYERRIFDLEQFHVEDYEVFQNIVSENGAYTLVLKSSSVVIESTSQHNANGQQ
ncbi:17159_t:CDS:2, partial [Racocetra persica]